MGEPTKSNCCCNTGNVCPTHRQADDAEKRAVFLHTHNAPKDWFIITYAEAKEAQVEAQEMKRTIAELRAKCSRQRTELRRLNKTLRAMWDGVRFSQKVRWGQERAMASKAKHEIKEAQQ